jgi:hypothetical protein
MIIIGSDYRPGLQQIARVDTETGELQERRLVHRVEAEKFCRVSGREVPRYERDGSQRACARV